MSDRPRLALQTARDLAAFLCRRWSLGPPERAVMGSVRRGEPTVGDLDLIAPMPEHRRRDALWEAIAASVARPGLKGDERGALFAPTQPVPSTAIGEAVMGLAEGFRMCRLLIRGKEGAEVQVEVSRYQDGGGGVGVAGKYGERVADALGRHSNRGWVELVKTGPGLFGKEFLTHWKTLYRIPEAENGSRDFFLLDGGGVRVSTPTELHAFQAARCLWAAPEQRREGAVLCVDWLDGGADGKGAKAPDWQRFRAAKAMAALGFGGGDEVRRAFGEQRVALAGWKP